MFPDLMSGVIDLAVVSIPSGLPFIKSGLVKALAVTGADRAPSLPDVPTMTEVGHCLADGRSLRACCARRDTPRSHRTPEARPSPKFSIRRRSRSVSPPATSARSSCTPEETAEFVRTEIDRYADVVKKAGIEPQK